MRAAYGDAQARLSPFMGSEAAANNQLMVEMGMATPESLVSDYEAKRAQLTRDYEQERAALVPAAASDDGGFAERPEGMSDEDWAVYSGWQGKRPSSVAASDMAALEAKYNQSMADLGAPPSAQAMGSYMQAPGYQGAIDEGVRAVDTAAAGGGYLYSGARGEKLRDVGQNVQQSYYSNYMNLLQNMANPKSTTNVSNIGIGQAGSIGAQNIAAADRASGFQLAGQEARGQFIADAAGGLGSAVGAYMDRPAASGGPQNVGAPINQPNNTGWV
jgi:hypothetical protein